MSTRTEKWVERWIPLASSDNPVSSYIFLLFVLVLGLFVFQGATIVFGIEGEELKRFTFFQVKPAAYFFFFCVFYSCLPRAVTVRIERKQGLFFRALKRRLRHSTTSLPEKGG